jgi:hypothetical protein
MIHDQARTSLLLIDSTDHLPPSIGHGGAVGLLTVLAAKPAYKVKRPLMQDSRVRSSRHFPILSQVREAQDEPILTIRAVPIYRGASAGQRDGSDRG